MILKSLAAFLPALIAGFGFVHLFWKSNQVSEFALKVFLGIGAGLGLTSCFYFLRLLLFPGQGGYLLVETIFLILVIVGLFIQKRVSFNINLKSFSFTRIQILLGLSLVFVGVVALYFLITYARVVPHGDYDAQSMWNLRARFIYRSGNAWESAFSPLVNRNFHLDYPLLVPLSVVGGWNTLGTEVLRVPSVLSLLYYFGIGGIAFSCTASLRSTSQAMIGAIILLATPGLLLFSTFQTADIPLTYFFLASASLLLLATRENQRGLFFLSGMMAGLAAWTKNEGMSFVVLMILCTVFVSGIPKVKANLFSLLAGLSFPLLIVILFKIKIPVSSDLFTNNGFMEIIPKLFDPARYLVILTHLRAESIQLGNWPVSILAVLLIYGLVMGLRRLKDPAEKAFWIIPLSQFAIYMLIYVITPYDLEWHLSYSMSRLLIHLFPMALCSFFLFVKTPEDVLNKVK